MHESRSARRGDVNIYKVIRLILDDAEYYSYDRPSVRPCRDRAELRKARGRQLREETISPRARQVALNLLRFSSESRARVLTHTRREKEREHHWEYRVSRNCGIF